jgi:hypothetical protein|tara:strand:+ start:1238 stop:1384 length:147 start_codon:yes stop_codon:yes gene_type:complete
MPILTSVSIKNKNATEYQELREYLKKNNKSIGDFLVESYVRLKEQEKT